MALSDVANTLTLILTLFNKLAFIGFCFFLGNLAFKGWRGKKNMILRIIITVTAGLICFFGGLIIKDLFSFNFFAAEYLSSLILAGVSYAILFLISSGFRIRTNYVTKKDINELASDIKTLKIQVAKLTKALRDKEIIPQELSEEDIKKELSKALEKHGVKKYSLISIKKIEDAWSCLIKTRGGRKEAVIDAYTGSLADYKTLHSPFEFLYKNPLSSIGILLLISLIIFLGLNINLATINAFNEAFDLTFLFKPPLPEGCLKANFVLENFKENQISFNGNNTLLEELVFSKAVNQYMIPSMTASARINNNDYYITTSYESQTTNLANVITVNEWENIYNVNVCVFTQNYTLCECIGTEKTDPVFTAPYLIELGFIEEALKNIILNSLTSIFR